MQRILIGLSASIFIICLCAWNFTSSFQELVDVDDLEERFYNKEIEFSGLELANAESILRALPTKNTVMNWLWESEELEKILQNHPLITDAVVEQCPNKRWNCFRINIKEDKPAAIVHLKDSFWLIAENGKFLTPIHSNHPASLLALPLISGVDLDFSSPDYVKGRTNYAMQTMRLIEHDSNKEVERIVLSNNGELKVKFRDMDLTAIFQFAEESDDLIKDEVKRLKLVLDNFQGQETLIRELDLAYNSQCVVKLTEQGKSILKQNNKAKTLNG